MTHKKRLLSALAVVAAGALMLTFAGPYKSGASDPVGVAALWGDYSDDNQYASKGTFNYDAPGDSEDVTLAASDITKLKDQIGKLALTAQAADAGLDSGMAGAVSDASTANTGALASLKASVDTLNATLASKEFGRDTTVMVYRTSVGNVDLAQATVYEAMTMSATGLPSFSKPEASLYAVYALGDNPAVDLTTATPLGLYSGCSGGGNSTFSLSYFPRGAYDKDTAVTLTLPANGSSANAYNVGKPYFFALARIAAEDRETKFGKVAVAKAQQCDMTELPAKCGSVESIEDAKYVFWFGNDISGEPAGIWKGSIATDDTISTASIATSETGVSTGYCNDVSVMGRRQSESLTYDGTCVTTTPQLETSITATLAKLMSYSSSKVYYYKGNPNSTLATRFTLTYYGQGVEVYKELTNITPVNSVEPLVGTDYVYWTDKNSNTTSYRRAATANVSCKCTENYYGIQSYMANANLHNRKVDYTTFTECHKKTETYTCQKDSVDNYAPSYASGTGNTFADAKNVGVTRQIKSNNVTGTKVTFAPLVK